MKDMGIKRRGTNGTRAHGTVADFWPGDFVQPFQIEGTGLRGRFARIGPSLNKALAPHGYPPLVAELLGEIVAIALVLASGLKRDAVFTLQTRTDGPISTLMADVGSDGGFRCYARYDAGQVALQTANGRKPVLAQALGNGHIAFTIDATHDTERHQGITEITGLSLVDCAHHYFRQSEQTLTALRVAADPGDDERGPSASIVMIQRMPPESTPPVRASEDDPADEDWWRSAILMNSVTAGELLNTDLAPQDLLFRLFHEDGVRLFTACGVRNVCRCSASRVRTTLRALGRDELDGMASKGRVNITCAFCKTDYVYDADTLDVLFADRDGTAD